MFIQNKILNKISSTTEGSVHLIGTQSPLLRNVYCSLYIQNYNILNFFVRRFMPSGDYVNIQVS